MTKENKAILCGVVAVLSWSTVATAFKIAGQYMTPFVMVLVSTVTAFAILSIVLACQGHLAKLAHLSQKQWLALACIGLINPTIYYMVLFWAYDLLPAQVAQPINYTWPIVLLILLAVFNHQRIPALKYMGMALSLAGVACISLGGKSIMGSISGWGLALGFLSAFLWASYWLLNKKLCGDIDATIAFFGTFLFGSIYMGIAAIFVGMPSLAIEALLSGAYIGCFEMAIPFLFFGIALRTTSNPTLINQMCYLSPFLSLFFIATILGEPIQITTYIGLVLIVAGLLFNERIAKR